MRCRVSGKTSKTNRLSRGAVKALKRELAGTTSLAGKPHGKTKNCDVLIASVTDFRNDEARRPSKATKTVFIPLRIGREPLEEEEEEEKAK